MSAFPQRSIDIPSQDLGQFPMSRELLHASADVVAGMGDMIPALAQRVTPGHPGLGETIIFYSRRSDESSQIVVSFLGKALGDLGEALGDKDKAFENPVLLLANTKTSAEPEHADHIDEHTFLADAPLGLRYITTNLFPTRIRSIPDYAAGNVARFSPHKEFHGARQIDATPERPRILLILDVL